MQPRHTEDDHRQKRLLAARLTGLLATRGWSQSDLGRQSKLERNLISLYCRGRTFPNDRNLSKLAQGFGLTVQDLLGDAITAPVSRTPMESSERQAFASRLPAILKAQAMPPPLLPEMLFARSTATAQVEVARPGEASTAPQTVPATEAGPSFAARPMTPQFGRDPMKRMFTSEDRQTFSKTLQELMEERGWHAAEMARQSGMSRVCVGRYLSGAHMPEDENLGKLAGALGVTPGMLLGEGPEHPLPAAERARLLRLYLGRRRWSQTDLAVRAGLADSTVPNLLNGMTTPDARTLRRIADALDLPVSVLIEAPSVSVEEEPPFLDDPVAFDITSLSRTLKENVRRGSVSQVELADRAGVTRSSISRCLRGIEVPDPHTIDRLAAALGVTAEDLREKRIDSVPVYAPRQEAKASVMFRVELLENSPGQVRLCGDLNVSLVTALAVLELLARDPARQEPSSEPQALRVVS